MQLEVVVEPTCKRVQPLPVKVPVPAPVRPRLTVPCGKDLVPEAVSETVTVQVESWLIARGVSQLTEVEVERRGGGALETAVVSEETLSPVLPDNSSLPLSIVAVLVMLPVELGVVTTSVLVRSPLLAGIADGNVQVTV